MWSLEREREMSRDWNAPKIKALDPCTDFILSSRPTDILFVIPSIYAMAFQGMRNVER